MRLKIGDLATMANCKQGTIRFYEKEGLLSSQSRTPRNYRIYNENDLARLRFILNCRKHDINMEDIKLLLKIRDAGGQDCENVHELVAKKLKNIEKEIANLEKIRSDLKMMLSREDCSLEGACYILKHFDSEDNCSLYPRNSIDSK